MPSAHIFVIFMYVTENQKNQSFSVIGTLAHIVMDIYVYLCIYIVFIPQMTDWDRYAAQEYELLVAEEGVDTQA